MKYQELNIFYNFSYTLVYRLMGDVIFEMGFGRSFFGSTHDGLLNRLCCFAKVDGAFLRHMSERIKIEDFCCFFVCLPMD